MTTDEIIEMAQECKLIGMRPHLDGIYSESLVSFAKLVAAKAIAKLESQEPVGRFAKFTDGIWRQVTDYSAGVPLYTHPPQRTWVGLTDEEVTDLWHKTEPYYNEHDFAKAYEAKLKEKNT